MALAAAENSPRVVLRGAVVQVPSLGLARVGREREAGRHDEGPTTQFVAQFHARTFTSRGTLKSTRSKRLRKGPHGASSVKLFPVGAHYAASRSTVWDTSKVLSNITFKHPVFYTYSFRSSPTAPWHRARRELWARVAPSTLPKVTCRAASPVRLFAWAGHTSTTVLSGACVVEPGPSVRFDAD